MILKSEYVSIELEITYAFVFVFVFESGKQFIQNSKYPFSW